MIETQLKPSDVIGEGIKLTYGRECIHGHVKSSKDGVIVVGDVKVILPEEYEITKIKLEKLEA